nr:helix-turn-helix domain-containing protein [Kitasatospora aureofaciens]
MVQADEGTVRDVIHKFNEIGLACLDPRWAGGCPRLYVLRRHPLLGRNPGRVEPVHHFPGRNLRLAGRVGCGIVEG